MCLGSISAQVNTVFIHCLHLIGDLKSLHSGCYEQITAEDYNKTSAKRQKTVQWSTGKHLSLTEFPVSY